MVDQLLTIGPDSLTAEFSIRPHCVFVQNGLLTESGLIENAAQACSAIVGQSYFEDSDLDGHSNKVVGYISAIKEVRIFGLPAVHDVLITRAGLVSRFDTGAMSVCTIRGRTFRNADLIVDCTLNFLIHEV